MHICLDIDDTITYAPEFFVQLVARFPEAEVSIVTFRGELEETRSYLDSLPIRFDRLIVSTDSELGKSEEQTLPEWKAGVVNDLKPDLFFEDMPEVVTLIDRSIFVFMPCDDLIRDWIADQIART